jgi:pimeloyl-ACP methyl ester carboxylesterase
VLFLSGAGHTAHVWDEFAPRFTDQFRVLALTRRGFGESEQPHSGYQRATLAEDIRALLDSLGIRRVHLVGHSIAGEEMTRFAGSYPERVGRLVYLDAAYDRIAARPAAQGAPGPGRSGAHGANSGEIFSGSYVALALGLRHPASSAKLERGVDLYV